MGEYRVNALIQSFFGGGFGEKPFLKTKVVAENSSDAAALPLSNESSATSAGDLPIRPQRPIVLTQRGFQTDSTLNHKDDG
ncbi:MAG TPA: hypothetical protein DEW46_01590 [Verrucomicrobia bacterium]|nr:hypothetical protein [Verrucomicrobiota bacterium]